MTTTHVHADGLVHAHEHAHSEESAEAHGQLGHGAPALDIGGDIGALVLYTTEDLVGEEIDVSLVGQPDSPTHTEILRRDVGGKTFWAGVYAALTEGEYTVSYDAPAGVEKSFTIRGGEVSELDWR